MNEFFKQELVRSEGIDDSYVQSAQPLFDAFDSQDVWQANYSMGYTPYVYNGEPYPNKVIVPLFLSNRIQSVGDT